MPKTIKGFGALTPLQEEFMEILAGLPDKEQFYLAGGTALSEYYLGHRLSFDLDYFTGTENLILPLSYQIETACREKGLSLKVVRRFGTIVELLIEKGSESLKVDLALDSPYRFEAPVFSREGIPLTRIKRSLSSGSSSAIKKTGTSLTNYSPLTTCAISPVTLISSADATKSNK